MFDKNVLLDFLKRFCFLNVIAIFLDIVILTWDSRNILKQLVQIHNDGVHILKIVVSNVVKKKIVCTTRGTSSWQFVDNIFN